MKDEDRNTMQDEMKADRAVRINAAAERLG
jgi:hypothetical protein